MKFAAFFSSVASASWNDLANDSTPSRSGEADRPWAWSSPSFQALDLKFAIRTDDPRLGRYLESVLLSQGTDGPATLEFAVIGPGEANGAGPGWHIVVDGRPHGH